jgi:oligopeptide transport system ATP-binding protein
VFDDEFLAIVRESGSDKTTVAKTVVGLESPTAGTITLNGERRGDAPTRHRDRVRWAGEVQYVFQEPYSSLNPRQRIRDVITTSVGIHQPDLDGAGRRAVARALLDDVGLGEEFGERLPFECPVASGNASLSRAHWPPTRDWSYSTRRSRHSTCPFRRRPATC